MLPNLKAQGFLHRACLPGTSCCSCWLKSERWIKRMAVLGSEGIPPPTAFPRDGCELATLSPCSYRTSWLLPWSSLHVHRFLLDTGLNQRRKGHWLNLGPSRHEQVLFGSTFLCAGPDRVGHFWTLCQRGLVLQVKLQSAGRKRSCQTIEVLWHVLPKMQRF